ncbi:hypothetical protein BDN72DRAFT_844555 [Pluteus cervinus]|uniref:Uncharacterized protein n=1 Tax=Pluteus cervinus TaxID=181527 RepID=A0ACD3AK80_9AGAR|nr:hypothetical protein BDN72DRAFT_844555 [Pluteus cervinus]
MSILSQNPFLYDVHALARERIDEEIASLTARLIALKTTRNTYSPIARLHPEIMQEVFVIASRTSPQWIGIGRTSISISWVCSSWRILALQTSALWSCIDFINPTWIDAALSRTRDRPLDFFLSLPSEYQGDIGHLASASLGNLQRIRELRIQSGWKAGLDQFTRLSPLWVNPAPLLVELKLSHVSLPPNLFSGTFPVLRTLALHACEFDWGSLPIHDGLQSLSITEPIVKTSAEDVLQKLTIVGPCLEELSFRQIIPWTGFSLPNQTPHFSETRHSFAKMKSFNMDEHAARFTTFILDHLSLPTNPDISIWVEGNAGQYDTVRSFVSCRGISGKWPIVSFDVGVEADHVVMHMAEERYPDRAGDGVEINDSNEADDRSQARRVSLTVEPSGGFANVILVLDILPLPEIKTLSFSGGYLENHGSILMDYFNAQGGVERLDIDVYFIPTFTAVIHGQNKRLRDLNGTGRGDDVREQDVDDEMKAQYRTTIIFHNLVTLRYTGDGDDYLFSWEYYEILREWLMWRKAAGVGIDLLVFSDVVIPSITRLEMFFKGIVKVECVGVRENVDGSVGMAFSPGY